VSFLQLARTVVAAHFNGLPADLYLNGIAIQSAVAGGTGLLGHGASPVAARRSGRRSKPVGAKRGYQDL
jgi:hypothetical protein